MKYWLGKLKISVFGIALSMLPIWNYAQGDLRNCGFGCTSNDITIMGFALVDAVTGNPIANSVSECGDGQTFQVKLEMTYKFNAAATRYNARFQSLLRIGNMDIFVNDYVGTFSSTTTEAKLIVFDTFTWECGTNLSFFNPQFFWKASEGEGTLETTYACNDYSNSKCSASTGEMIVEIPVELPVVWHNFSVSMSEKKDYAEINWSTLKEWESSHFEIERSIYGIDKFKIIDSVSAANYSFEINYYQYLDKNIPPYVSRVYYRLKQVDLDGKYDYSKVQMLNINRTKEDVGAWLFYPNPMKENELKVSLKKPSVYNGEEITIKVIANQKIYVQLQFTPSNPYEIDLGHFLKNIPKGILLIELSWRDQSEVFKVIKH
ncbi:hypothetical protein ACFSKL_13900 [Belliella marina]|uniref:T9SS type A sorting domain-containing protein n=1 Tax=Belliella marina TaxID=1644146 RepID=A0ABW4VRI8_9BACT